ncbi:MAG: hypothetical protein WCG27_12665, partial [Pseudomonadota bacterium]
MKLEFDQQIVPPSFYQELEFANYLALFDLDLPMIPYLILTPLTPQEGPVFYQGLNVLMELAQQKKINLDKIIALGKKLPYLETMLPAFEKKELTPMLLLQLGDYVSGELELYGEEQALSPDAGRQKDMATLKGILERYTENKYKSIRLTDEEKSKQEEIKELDKDCQQTLMQLEKEIYQKTKLKMIYPYPKEISQDHPNLKLLESCPLITLTPKADNFLVEYSFPIEVAKKIEARERLRQDFENLMQDKLNLLNEELSSFYPSFRDHYFTRKSGLYLLALAWAARHHHLVLPTFNEDLVLDKARLPALTTIRKEKYVPLSIAINQKGANVLFGGNMTGKTTVLKTIY